jgi:hypothetical protein
MPDTDEEGSVSVPNVPPVPERKNEDRDKEETEEEKEVYEEEPGHPDVLEEEKDG